MSDTDSESETWPTSFPSALSPEIMAHALIAAESCGAPSPTPEQQEAREAVAQRLEGNPNLRTIFLRLVEGEDEDETLNVLSDAREIAQMGRYVEWLLVTPLLRNILVRDSGQSMTFALVTLFHLAGSREMNLSLASQNFVQVLRDIVERGNREQRHFSLVILLNLSIPAVNKVPMVKEGLVRVLQGVVKGPAGAPRMNAMVTLMNLTDSPTSACLIAKDPGVVIQMMELVKNQEDQAHSHALTFVGNLSHWGDQAVHDRLVEYGVVDALLPLTSQQEYIGLRSTMALLILCSDPTKNQTSQTIMTNLVSRITPEVVWRMVDFTQSILRCNLVYEMTWHITEPLKPVYNLCTLRQPHLDEALLSSQLPSLLLAILDEFQTDELAVPLCLDALAELEVIAHRLQFQDDSNTNNNSTCPASTAPARSWRLFRCPTRSGPAAKLPDEEEEVDSNKTDWPVKSWPLLPMVTDQARRWNLSIPPTAVHDIMRSVKKDRRFSEETRRRAVHLALVMFDQHRWEAFLMAFHPRLGAASPVRALPRDLLPHILSFL